MPAGRQEPRSGWSAGSGSVSTAPVRAEWYQAVTSSSEAWASARVTGNSAPLASASTKPWNWPVYCDPDGRRSAQRLFGFLGEGGAPELEGPRPGGRVVGLGRRLDGDVVEVPHELRRLARRAEGHVHGDEGAVGGATDGDRAVLGLDVVHPGGRHRPQLDERAADPGEQVVVVDRVAEDAAAALARPRAAPRRVGVVALAAAPPGGATTR